MSDFQFSKRKEAFTIIEVVVAMMLFAIVIAGGFGCLSLGLNLVENSASSRNRVLEFFANG
jgi:prepilin-type N-terminal cleavage/methylation domain-containing protein